MRHAYMYVFITPRLNMYGNCKDISGDVWEIFGPTLILAATMN